MRSEKQIREELDKTLELHRANVDKWTKKQLDDSTDKVVALQNELSKTLSEGAKDCPCCGGHPIGMHRRTIEHQGLNIKIYEVGCLNCRPFPELDKSKKETGMMISYSSQGTTVEQAVEKWNNNEYLKKAKEA
jgi:hypothetical protein